MKYFCAQINKEFAEIYTITTKYITSSQMDKVVTESIFSYIAFSKLKHTTYRKNNNLEKCAGMGLNGFQIR